jgi:hypothetical protein
MSSSDHTPARVSATRWVEWVWMTKAASGSV